MCRCHSSNVWSCNIKQQLVVSFERRWKPGVRSRTRHPILQGKTAHVKHGLSPGEENRHASSACTNICRRLSSPTVPTPPLCTVRLNFLVYEYVKRPTYDGRTNGLVFFPPRTAWYGLMKETHLSERLLSANACCSTKHSEQSGLKLAIPPHSHYH